jgi:sugar lactone lactonase YvrE
MHDVKLIVDQKAILGEGPCWDDTNKCLYWVDIMGKKLHIHSPETNTNQEIDVGQYIGTVAVREKGGLIVALQNGFYFLDIESEALTPISDPESHLPKNRFNDGKCDPAGRFWAGTMELHITGPNASLYRLETNLQVDKVLDNVTISNGMAWSSDFKTMYYIDTPTQQVFAFDYDFKTGEIKNGKAVITIAKADGSPDGMTIDEEGMLWIAHWGGARVTRWNPNTGKILATIKIPVSKVTACVFGGENLDELFITTARSEDEPTSGGLFKAKVGVKGTLSYTFKG